VAWWVTAATSGSGWSATRSWAGRTPRPGAASAASSSSPSPPRLAAICGRDREQVAAAAGHQLRFFEATGEPATEGFRTIQVTRADHPYAGAWWPEGHTIGYEHTFTHEVRDLLLAIADNRDPVPSFADGLQVQEVLDAVQRSAASGAGWTEVGR
jgi:hypothetical protein